MVVLATRIISGERYAVGVRFVRFDGFKSVRFVSVKRSFFEKCFPLSNRIALFVLPDPLVHNAHHSRAESPFSVVRAVNEPEIFVTLEQNCQFDKRIRTGLPARLP